eukprot:sb/3471570/
MDTLLVIERELREQILVPDWVITSHFSSRTQFPFTLIPRRYSTTRLKLQSDPYLTASSGERVLSFYSTTSETLMLSHPAWSAPIRHGITYLFVSNRLITDRTCDKLHRLETRFGREVPLNRGPLNRGPTVSPRVKVHILIMATVMIQLKHTVSDGLPVGNEIPGTDRNKLATNQNSLFRSR